VKCNIFHVLLLINSFDNKILHSNLFAEFLALCAAEEWMVFTDKTYIAAEALNTFVP